jgi:hypothetical protein
MTLARCLAADLSVRTLDGFGQRFGRGAIVDLDAELGESGLTLRDALSDHVQHFELIETPDEPPVVVDED